MFKFKYMVWNILKVQNTDRIICANIFMFILYFNNFKPYI